MVSAWMRIDGRTMPFLAKATANYANSALARVEAIRQDLTKQSCLIQMVRS